MPIQDEGHAIADVVERLTVKFPAVGHVTVAQAVRARLAVYGDAAVRDFVPVLVEHEVTDQLRARRQFATSE